MSSSISTLSFFFLFSISKLLILFSTWSLSVTQVIILEIRSRAMKAKTKAKGYLFADSLHWVLSPTSGKLLIAPKEERIDVGGEDDGGGDDDQSEVFHSVKSCFSRCSREKEIDYLSHLWTRSVWHEFAHCEGWPFGLYKKALALPPLPSSPSDSWTWRKRNQLGAKVCARAAASF